MNGLTASCHSAGMLVELVELIKTQLLTLAVSLTRICAVKYCACVGIPHIPLLCLLQCSFPRPSFLSEFSDGVRVEGLGMRLELDSHAHFYL